MILTTNEEVFNTIFHGSADNNVYWRVVGGVPWNYNYQFCNEYGEIPVGEPIRSSWQAGFERISEHAYKSLDPNYKDEGAIINKIRVMAARFEKRKGVAA